MEEDRTELGAVIVRRGDEASVHARMTTRLLDQQPPDVVKLPGGGHPAVRDGRAGRDLDPPVTIRNGSPAV